MRSRPASFRAAIVAASALATSGCALYSDVSIQPLVITPAKIERGADMQAMLRRADYLRAVELGPLIDSRPRKAAAELVGLGVAELASGRFDAARHHLRGALDLNPLRATYAEAAWALSQVEYLDNNYGASLDWAHTAMEYGLTVLPWHMNYLEAMSNIPAYRFSGLPSDEIPLIIGKPDVPRLQVRINKSNTPHIAVIDSGAVLSIMSRRLAAESNVKPLPIERGTFYGLLGEPISVTFGLIETLELGALVIQNVPIAIMPDEKMRFLVNDRQEFRIDFLLGANLLKEFRLELNYTRNRAIFTRLSARDRRPSPDQNLFFENFRPHVRGAVNGHGWFLFVLDTGSEVTYLNEAQVGKLPINYNTPRMHNATLQGLGGSKKRGAKIEDVQIGVDKWTGVFRTIPMYTAGEQDRSVGIIGENFMKNFNVVIDFGRMRVDLERR